MNETANATLALGALPVMAHAREEVEEMVGLASALVLNIGTLSKHWVDAMLLAGRAAGEAKIPVVLDPVGAERPYTGPRPPGGSSTKSRSRFCAGMRARSRRSSESGRRSAVSSRSVRTGRRPRLHVLLRATSVSSSRVTGKVDQVSDGER